MPQQNDDPESGMMPLPYTHFSQALSHLPAGRRGNVNTLCARCKNSCWIATEQDLTCFCRVLFKEVWTIAHQEQLLACDGALLVPEAEE